MTSSSIKDPEILKQYTSLYDKFITIIPENSSELEEMVKFGSAIALKNEPDNFLPASIINSYWSTVSNSPLYEKYLESQIDITKEKISWYENTYQSLGGLKVQNPIRIFFDHGYNSVLTSKPIDYNKLYDLTYAEKANQVDKAFYISPVKIAEHILEGVKYAMYEGFLNNESKRLQSGEDIRKPEGKIEIESLESKQGKTSKERAKLIWNGNHEVLYDIFAQLLHIQHTDRHQPIIGNTIDNLARFISDNVEGMPNANTVKTRLSKLKNHEEERPQTYRIEIKVVRS